MSGARRVVRFLAVVLAPLGCGSADAPAPSPDRGDAAPPNESLPDGGPSAMTEAADAGDARSTTEPEHSGEATYYDADGTGACGFAPSSDFFVAAMNADQYAKSLCGRCVSVSGPKGTTVVRIVDRCGGCRTGDLDLSQTAFAKIADLDDGRVKITWRFVACP